MEALTDYDFTINYHPEKANKVADALSRKSHDTLALMRQLPPQLAKEIAELDLIIVHGRIARLEVRPIILEDIRKAQITDEYMVKAQKQDQELKKEEFV